MLYDKNFKDQRLLSTLDAAQYLGVTEGWLKTTRFRPELDGPPFVKFSRTVRYDLLDLDDWLSKRKYRGTHEAYLRQARGGHE